MTVVEGNPGPTDAVFQVALLASSTGTVTVDYATENATATAGSDYTAASGTLTFIPGQTVATIAVTVNGDTDVEPNETFSVILSNAGDATLGNSQGAGIILNDD